jgi:hypothetical protein
VDTLEGGAAAHYGLDGEKMNLIKKGSVTDALIQSTEEQDDATHVLIILYAKREDSYGLKVNSNDDMTIETANWLCDKVKEWLLRD